MCPSLTNNPEVGSKPTQPAPGKYTSTQACKSVKSCSGPEGPSNDFSSDYVESIKADENGGFQIVWENTTNEYPFQIEVNANEAGAYLESDITSNAPELESKDGKLIWNSGDTRGLQLTVNETEYNSASSTSYPGGGYQFNGFNEGKQDPAQLNYIEIAPGIKAIVWANGSICFSYNARGQCCKVGYSW